MGGVEVRRVEMYGQGDDGGVIGVYGYRYAEPRGVCLVILQLNNQSSVASESQTPPGAKTLMLKI